MIFPVKISFNKNIRNILSIAGRRKSTLNDDNSPEFICSYVPPAYSELQGFCRIMMIQIRTTDVL